MRVGAPTAAAHARINICSKRAFGCCRCAQWNRSRNHASISLNWSSIVKRINLRKTFNAALMTGGALGATSVLAQSQGGYGMGSGMMGGWGGGWMGGGGYGGMVLLGLLVIVVAAVVAWIVSQKKK